MFNSERFNFNILSVHNLQISSSERIVPAKTFNVLVFRHKGKAKVIHKGKTYELKKDDVTFIPSNYEYKIITETDEEVTVIHFSADIKDCKDIKILHPTHFDKFLSLFQNIFKCYTEKKTGYVYKLDSLFLSILENIEIQTLEKDSNSVIYNVQKAIDEMHLQISEPELSIAYLSKFVGYCPAYFRRVFKNVTGVSPNDYLRNIRLERAVSLLESGYYNVEQVSDLCGFGSSKYFSTTFKEVYGYPPSKILPKG